MTTVFDSFLFRDLFGTPTMREIFSDAGFLDRVVRTEVALARAQAQVGVVPEHAAEAIAARCDPEQLDPEQLDRDRLGRETKNVGYPILPIVTQLVEHCGDAGDYLHWGATTQDIMDTATVLQCADGLDVLAKGLDRLRAALRRLANAHVETVTPGRTHLQHALPITFGHRAAVWVSALDRHAERLAGVRRRDLMVQFGGAAGALASLGDGPTGLAVRAALADELGLRDPQITWQVARDGLVEIVTLFAAIGGSIGKIGADVAMMTSTEFGELAEPFVPGRGASSTMPQKRNPISSELMVATAKLLRDKASAMLDAMMQDFERATGPWHVEWVVVPEAFLLLSASLQHGATVVGGLQVNADRMRANLDLSGGLVVAEAVMMALAPVLGRQYRWLDRLRAVWAGADDRGSRPVTPGGPPLLFGGSLAPALRRVATAGTGWIAGGTSAAQFADFAVRVRDSWTGAGRTGRPHLAVSVMVALGPHRPGAGTDAVAAYYADQHRDEVIAATLTTPDAVRTAIQDFASAGADEIILTPNDPDPATLDSLHDALPAWGSR